MLVSDIPHLDDNVSCGGRKCHFDLIVTLAWKSQVIPGQVMTVGRNRRLDGNWLDKAWLLSRLIG